ncbi:MAG: aryl-sulfate sulfotransferase [Hungatella sp.]|jgi:hypothetical protein|nr:aryl-sulfate sulfotransferase [Hungatella sp.]
MNNEQTKQTISGNKRSIAPRPPINQGIDYSNATVAAHADIYNRLIARISPSNIISNPSGVILNPFDTAPLSAVLCIWCNTTDPITVLVGNSDISLAVIPIQYQFTPSIGANLVPIIGLVPASSSNTASFESTEGNYTVAPPYSLITGPLPPGDSTEVSYGFLEMTSVIPTRETGPIGELYFMGNYERYLWAFDSQGIVRWYATKTIPTYNFVKLLNGKYISVDQSNGAFKQLTQFDLIGRIYTVYILDNRAHHCLHQASNGNLIMDSEYSNGRPEEPSQERTEEDGTSVISLATGLELAYYDYIDVLDFNRKPRPYVPAEDDYDWLHLNQSYLDTNHNLMIGSGRHQSCVFGVTADTNELRFLIATHEGWDAAFERYLLTPVDSQGTPLYDFTKQEDIDAANLDFWTWGQHNCVEIPNEDPDIVEMRVFDNGNFRSRDDAKSLYPYDNWSRTLCFKINLSLMTIEKTYEYGRAEVRSRGYSSFVGSQQGLPNGNLYTNFGGGIRNSDDHIITETPGESDIYDPLSGDDAMGHILVQEIETSTGNLVFEAVIRSGMYKTYENWGPLFRYDCNCYRTYKLPII